MLRIYYIRSNVSNSMYCSVVKIWFQSKYLVSQHVSPHLVKKLKCRGKNSCKNEMYALRCRYFLMIERLKYKIKSSEFQVIRNYETMFDPTHYKTLGRS